MGRLGLCALHGGVRGGAWGPSRGRGWEWCQLHPPRGRQPAPDFSEPRFSLKRASFSTRLTSAHRVPGLQGQPLSWEVTAGPRPTQRRQAPPGQSGCRMRCWVTGPSRPGAQAAPQEAAAGGQTRGGRCVPVTGSLSAAAATLPAQKPQGAASGPAFLNKLLTRLEAGNPSVATPLSWSFCSSRRPSRLAPLAPGTGGVGPALSAAPRVHGGVSLQEAGPVPSRGGSVRRYEGTPHPHTWGEGHA